MIVVNDIVRSTLATHFVEPPPEKPELFELIARAIYTPEIHPPLSTRIITYSSSSVAEQVDHYVTSHLGNIRILCEENYDFGALHQFLVDQGDIDYSHAFFYTTPIADALPFYGVENDAALAEIVAPLSIEEIVRTAYALRYQYRHYEGYKDQFARFLVVVCGLPERMNAEPIDTWERFELLLSSPPLQCKKPDLLVRCLGWDRNARDPSFVTVKPIENEAILLRMLESNGIFPQNQMHLLKEVLFSPPDTRQSASETFYLSLEKDCAISHYVTFCQFLRYFFPDESNHKALVVEILNGNIKWINPACFILTILNSQYRIDNRSDLIKFAKKHMVRRVNHYRMDLAFLLLLEDMSREERSVFARKVLKGRNETLSILAAHTILAQSELCNTPHFRRERSNHFASIYKMVPSFPLAVAAKIFGIETIMITTISTPKLIEVLLPQLHVPSMFLSAEESRKESRQKMGEMAAKLLNVPHPTIRELASSIQIALTTTSLEELQASLESIQRITEEPLGFDRVALAHPINILGLDAQETDASFLCMTDSMIITSCEHAIYAYDRQTYAPCWRYPERVLDEDEAVTFTEHFNNRLVFQQGCATVVLDADTGKLLTNIHLKAQKTIGEYSITSANETLTISHSSGESTVFKGATWIGSHRNHIYYQTKDLKLHKLELKEGTDALLVLCGTVSLPRRVIFARRCDDDTWVCFGAEGKVIYANIPNETVKESKYSSKYPLPHNAVVDPSDGTVWYRLNKKWYQEDPRIHQITRKTHRKYFDAKRHPLLFANQGTLFVQWR